MNCPTKHFPSQRPQFLGLYPDGSHVLLHGHEALEAYRPGGYHPVSLEDSFLDGRYVIRNKLGYGGYSTVWLARDEIAQAWVSIKIKVAGASTDDVDKDPECRVLDSLERYYVETAQDKPRPFVRLLDRFRVTGPNGIHNCLVMELLGPPLSQVNFGFNMEEYILQPNTVLRASRQALEAVTFAHQAGWAHGDISPSNLAFTCRRFQDDDDELMNALGEAYAVPYDYPAIPRSCHLPKQLVRLSMWPCWFDTPEEDVCFIDWGGAFPVSGSVTKLAQPRDLRSPETFFVGSFDHRHDWWRAGCVIWALFFQTNPFVCVLDTDDSFLRRIIMKLGPLPPDWHQLWEEMVKRNPEAESDALVTEAFEPRRAEIISKCNESEYIDKDEFTEQDYEALKTLLPVIQGLLRYKPESRDSPEQAASYIGWIDHRREAYYGPSSEDGHSEPEMNGSRGSSRESPDKPENDVTQKQRAQTIEA